MRRRHRNGCMARRPTRPRSGSRITDGAWPGLTSGPMKPPAPMRELAWSRGDSGYDLGRDDGFGL
jgi:hypothetical protein